MRVHRRRSVLAAALFMCVAGTAAAQDVITIRLETYAGPKHAMNTEGWPQWVRQAEAASNGRLKFEMSYPPVDPRALYDRVRNGIADMAWITHGYTTGRFVLPEIVELPNVDGDGATMSRALWRIHQRHFAKLDEYKGVEALTVFTHGPGMLHTRRPVTSLKDLEGMKVRTGGGVQSEIAKRLGIVAVSAPATKAHEMLSQGVADGIFFSLETITSFRLGDVVRYHYSVPGGLYTASFAVVMNKARFASLPAPHREALARVIGEPMAVHMGKTWDDADKLSASELAKTKNVVAALPANVAADLQRRIADIEQDWIKRAREVGLADPAAVLRELRAEIASIKAGR